MPEIMVETQNPETGQFETVGATTPNGLWVVLAAVPARSLRRFTTNCRRHGKVEVVEDERYLCPLCLGEQND